eukprot:UC1_evm1s514
MPHEYFSASLSSTFGVKLPDLGHYAVAMLYLPKGTSSLSPATNPCLDAFKQISAKKGFSVLCTRPVPTDSSCLGPVALSKEPSIVQVFLTSDPESPTGKGKMTVEQKLYLLEREASHSCSRICSDNFADPEAFHVCSISRHNVVYKGQLASFQVSKYFKDLSSPDFGSHVALVHSRFSTNTFPSWHRAQPLRKMCHNGEINTHRGNKNYMRARQGQIRFDSMGLNDAEREAIKPLIEDGLSDSGSLNGAIEMLLASGRPIPEAIMMLVPEAWQNDVNMEPHKRDFYEFMSCIQEPWDGPALVAFTDG